MPVILGCVRLGSIRNKNNWNNASKRLFGSYSHSGIAGFHSGYSAPRSRLAGIYSGIHSYSGIFPNERALNWLLQKLERTGKEYDCFPFVWKTKNLDLFNATSTFNMNKFPRKSYLRSLDGRHFQLLSRTINLAFSVIFVFFLTRRYASNCLRREKAIAFFWIIRCFMKEINSNYFWLQINTLPRFGSSIDLL